MRKGHGGEAQQQVGPLPDALIQSAVSPEDKGQTMRLVDGQSLEPLRKLQRIHRLTSLIEGNRVTILRDGLQKPCRLGADDRPILRTLSTDFFELNWEEMFDSIDITVDQGVELGVRMGTRP